MQTVASSTSSAGSDTLTSLLHSPAVVFKLALLTFVSLVPILARDWLKGLIGRSTDHGEQEPKLVAVDLTAVEGRRWSFREWRARKSAGVEVRMGIHNEKAAVVAP